MTVPSPVIRDARPADAEAMAAIYAPYVRDTTVTFEEAPVEPAELARRMAEVSAKGLPWLVAEQNGRVVGYAYATTWRARSGYRHTAEIAVYCHADAVGRGIGTALYGVLVPRLAALGLHAIIGGIALPNAASIALHEKFGLRHVATFPEVGRKFGRWVDVGFWQRTFGAADQPSDEA